MFGLDTMLDRLGIAAEPPCVCGHPESEHRPVEMSVPMLPKTPTYKMPTQLHNNVASTHPTATYLQQQCHCGCTIYTPDE